MKKTLMLAAVLVLVGCGEKKADGMAGDTAGMAPSGTMSDTGMGMGGMSDSMSMSSDSTMARDTMHK
ncbi:MAG: hypothetical protein M3Q93_14840 [Gemmatimonadota bacterium]|nr:hypothetical protein [Gemmatimonadales bacterium]MDQ3138850.1 hypothetical protein [Gemmatimonadota bacterium]